ncbi:MAG: hypothetical protein FJ096_08065 [Deltaproteobacteria bacterium]|nr:hypothetical protein [Deltaproteobacteria bacterium]
MHGFGPVSGAVLAIMGKGPREGCLEDDFGLGYPIAVEADGFLRSFEDALDARGVPYAFVGGELKAAAFDGARWVVCATSGCLAGELVSELTAARARGAEITVGPRAPRYDAAWKPANWAGLLDGANVLELHDPATVDSLVASMVHALQLPTFASDPDVIHVTAHEDAGGTLRVLFVINASDEDQFARLTTGVDAEWQDAMTEARHVSAAGVLEVRVKRHSVRMLLRR